MMTASGWEGSHHSKKDIWAKELREAYPYAFDSQLVDSPESMELPQTPRTDHEEGGEFAKP